MSTLFLVHHGRVNRRRYAFFSSDVSSSAWQYHVDCPFLGLLFNGFRCKKMYVSVKYPYTCRKIQEDDKNEC